jgi:hypothetical protein
MAELLYRLCPSMSYADYRMLDCAERACRDSLLLLALLLLCTAAVVLISRAK